MRLVFCAVSAYGHLLPLAPLMEGALREGHDVAVVVSAELADVVRDDLPEGVEHLPAGPMPAVLMTEAGRRAGYDVAAPSAQGVGELFGGVALDLTVDDAVDAARVWGAEMVISEVYCTVGPMIAAALGLPWHEVWMTAVIPSGWARAIQQAAAIRYDQRGLEPVPATSVLDLWPPLLRDPTERGDSGVPVLPVRARAHRRATPTSAVPAFDDARPRVLVTLGTVVSDGDVLDAVVDAVAGNAVDVLATRGVSALGSPVVGEDRLGTGGGQVRFVSFVPIDELLENVDLVVSSGGAGTVLAALSHGIPLVLWPLGADQPAIAERVTSVGAAITVSSARSVGPAVADVLDDPGVRARAGEVATSLAAAEEPRAAIAHLVGAAPGAAAG